jgi:hypothetical protein
MGIQEYRLREYVQAERIEHSGTVFTSHGPVFGKEGDYLLHRSGRVVYVVADAFEDKYEPVPEDVSEARKFVPGGKTVDQVLEFLKENPDEVERVKKLEREGGSRKGILEYEV